MRASVAQNASVISVPGQAGGSVWERHAGKQGGHLSDRNSGRQWFLSFLLQMVTCTCSVPGSLVALAFLVRFTLATGQAALEAEAEKGLHSPASPLIRRRELPSAKPRRKGTSYRQLALVRLVPQVNSSLRCSVWTVQSGFGRVLTGEGGSPSTTGATTE